MVLDLDDDREAIIKRAQRTCARDHAPKDDSEFYSELIREPYLWVGSWDMRDTLREEKQRWRSWRQDCMPWPLIRVEEVTDFRTAPRHGCIGSVLLIYGRNGAGALYGVEPDGTLQLWAD